MRLKWIYQFAWLAGVLLLAFLCGGDLRSSGQASPAGTKGNAITESKAEDGRICVWLGRETSIIPRSEYLGDAVPHR